MECYYLDVFFKKYILLIMLLRLFHFPPFIPLHPAHPSYPHPPTCIPPATPALSSCPWVIHVSSLASTFPTLFLTAPLSILYLPFMLLILYTFPPISPHPLPADNPRYDLHFCDSVPVSNCLLSLFLFLIF